MAIPKGGLNKEAHTISNGKDDLVIVRDLADIPGGRTLDMTGFAPDIVQAGHVIIADAQGNAKPMPINSNEYATLPGNHTYLGILKSSITKSRPFAAILVAGQVNSKVCPFPIKPDMKTEMAQIHFL